MQQPREDIFFAAVETTRMPMVVSDPRQPDNPIIFANHAFLSMTGYEPREILGTNCRFLQGKDTDPETIEEIRVAIKERREVATEILNYRKDGSSFWNALFISPVYNKAGELIYFFASQLDVSRRRDAEDALRQAQKMEALGQLTGGIAHDFNNLLQVILGYLESIESNLNKPDLDRARLIRQAQISREAATRAATLTQQLLSFARKQQLQGRTMNINALLAGMGEMASHVLGDHIELVLDLDPALRNCRIDPTQCEGAVLNILINARDAMVGRDHQSIKIQTRNVDVAEDSDSISELSPGSYVAIAITDTGSGMPSGVLDRVLDPFFTTKEEGKGTGLGLSMVYGFAKQSGGSVHIYSEEDIGTTVRLFFPANDAKSADKSAMQRASVSDRRGTETILVVEDREDVSALAKDILEDYGYTVLTASNGTSALQLLSTHTHIDLLFTDLIMPGGINGVVLARQAKQKLPKLRVLLTTGYADSSIERTDAKGTEFDVIHKPYGRSELARKVRIILDGPTGIS